MDPSGSADNPIENLKPFNLMRFPEEIVCMIFREFLSKPAIHYADFKFAFPRHVVGRLHAGDIIIMVLREWAQYDIKSGYVSSDTLARTCRLARDVALSTIIEPSRIRFENVHKVVDASTDVLCLVHPPFQNVQQFERGISPDWEPKLDAGQVGSSLGNIRRAGLRVSQEIWCNLLENWFLVTESIVRNDFDYQYRDGHLHRSHLGVLMSCFSDLQAFYLILTNVTEDDWNTYYAGFPIAFHDHVGSYVEVNERPTHPSVMDRLWRSEGIHRTTMYPYPDGAKFDITDDQLVGERVNELMEPSHRVSLLLAHLHAAKAEAMHNKDLSGLKLRVLARKPAGLEHGLGTSVSQSTNLPSIPKDEYFIGVDLQPHDSELKWMKQALGRIIQESDEMHIKEPVSYED